MCSAKKQHNIRPGWSSRPGPLSASQNSDFHGQKILWFPKSSRISKICASISVSTAIIPQYSPIFRYPSLSTFIHPDWSLSISVYLSESVYLYLPLHPTLSIALSMSLSLSRALSIYLSIYQSIDPWINLIHRSIHPSIDASISVSLHLSISV